MGITGLLPLLKSIQKPTHLRKFAGQVIGVDAYGWLHRGTVACAIELAQQKPTRKHIDFALNRVRMLIHFGVKPCLVFDGDYLPSKAHTESERAARRKESRRLGLELLGMGRVAQAHLELQKAVDVTPSMARELIEELKVLGVPFVVAPYEADAQLAYLEKRGVISGVLSEDSDLLVFGVNCLLTKLDQYGDCVMINRSHFTACREVSLVGWSDKEFRMMAMLSGCDYLPGLEKMGLKTAYRVVRKHKQIERVIRTLQFDGKMKVPPGYLEAFTNAERTFLYQWAFCSEAKALVNLNTVPAELDVANMPFIGHYVEPELAAGVACGDLDPTTKKPLIFNARPQHSSIRTAMTATPNEKQQGKPIAEFFKARRTPLAELDPNSMTPSPSQQRLLENQQGTSWSASHAPMGPPPRTRTTPIEVPMSAPQPSRRAFSERFTSATPTTITTTTMSTSKRQRLCSGNSLASQMAGSIGMQAATSRFFEKKTLQPSPSVRKATTQRRNNDFELWSDDSAAEAVAELAATQEQELQQQESEVKGGKEDETKEVAQTPSPRKRKKIDVFVDEASGSAVQTSVDTARLKRGDGDSASVTPSLVKSNPKTAFRDAESRSERTPFSKGISAGFSALRERFSLDASALPPNNNLSGPKSAPRNVLDSSRQRQDTDEEVQIHEPVTPKLTNTKFWTEDDHTGNDQPVLEQDWQAFEQDELADHASFPVLAQGSEDLLVPNSPEEEVVDRRDSRPRLSLGRFAFAG